MRSPAIALLAVLTLVAGSVVSVDVSAHGRVRTHVGIGFHFGSPYWSPWWWGPPAYYYHPVPVYVSPPEPKVYVERSEVDAPAAAAQDRPSGDWWYYCEATRGYYPYVKTCPSGWQRVPPAPPPG